jgi:hypothetical protein
MAVAGRASLAGLLLGAMSTIPVTAAQTPTPTVPTRAPGPGSAIGDESVFAISISPAYRTTGLIALMSSPIKGCGGQQGNSCLHLWASHDGGSTWSRPRADGWNGGRPTIVADRHGHEAIYSASDSLIRSDDGGNTWSAVGNGSFVSVSPKFGTDSTVAVAGGGNPDYLAIAGVDRPVKGSGNIATLDQGFMFAPDYPNGGAHAPVLLAGADSQSLSPVVLQCTVDFTCTGAAATLTPSPPMSAPATLFPSAQYGTDGVVYAQTEGGIYKSVNGGLTFTQIRLGDPSATEVTTQGFAMTPGYSENGSVHTVYVAVLEDYVSGKTSHTAGGIYRSTDAGKTWSPVGAPGPFDQGAVALALAPDGRLFAGYMQMTTGHAGLMCSVDGGASWRASCPPVGVGVADGAAGDGAGGGSRGLATARVTSRSGLVQLALIVAVVLAGLAALRFVVGRLRRRVT